MNETKIHVLKSGNLLKVEYRSLGNRGGVTGEYTRPPSPEDAKEARLFLIAQTPPGARMLVVAQGTPAQITAAFDEHLTGVSRN